MSSTNSGICLPLRDGPLIYLFVQETLAKGWAKPGSVKIHKLYDPCNGMYYSLNRKEILTHTTIRKNLENIMLHEIGQRQ